MLQKVCTKPVVFIRVDAAYRALSIGRCEYNLYCSIVWQDAAAHVLPLTKYLCQHAFISQCHEKLDKTPLGHLQFFASEPTNICRL